MFAMKRRLVLALLLVSGLAACFEFPFGERGAKPTDPRYSGLWLRNTTDGYAAWVVVPFDASTYCVVEYECDADGSLRNPSSVYQAWLNESGQTVFMSLENILRLVPETNRNKKHQYHIAQLTLGSSGTLIVRTVDNNFEALKKPSSEQDLAAKVMTHIGDPRTFSREITLRRVDPKNSSEISVRDSLIVFGETRTY
jgi:hypothetical protein